MGEEKQIMINISTLEGKEFQAILLNTILKPLLSEHVVVAMSFDIPRLSQLFGGKAHSRGSSSLKENGLTTKVLRSTSNCLLNI